MTHEERTTKILHGFRYLAFAFRDVVAVVRMQDGSKEEIPVPGVVYSEYKEGPALFALADWIAWNHRDKPIAFVSFARATPLGRQLEPVK